MMQLEMIRKPVIATVSLALTLSVSGLASIPAHASVPGNGYYGCATGSFESSTPDANSKRFQISGGIVVAGTRCDGAVVITDGVTSIGNGSFDGSALTSISLPSSVTRIGQNAFYGTTGLTSITLPSSLTTIGDRAFASTSSLASISIPVGVTSIGTSAFQGTALSSITIPEGITSIPSSVFYNAVELTSVFLPSSVTDIDINSFAGATALTSIVIASNSQSFSSIDGVVFNKDVNEVLRYPLGKSASSYTVPESVTRIGDGAFASATSLTSIVIPSSVTSIGTDAFAGATSLTSIVIPSSVTSIGDYAFLGATSLASINIPDGISTIGESAFSNTALTSINIPSSVTSIRYGAFNGTSTLAIVNFLGNAPLVEEEAFFGVASGAKANIGSNATGFGTEATWNGLEIDRSVSVPSHTVSYNAAGGSSVTEGSFTEGESIQTAPVSTRSGFTLSGWSTTESGSVVTFPYAPVVTSDITLYAIWAPINVSANTPEAATNAPAVAVYSPRILIGGKLAAKPIAAGLGIAVASKSKTTLTISKSSKKYCKIKSGKVVGIKAGSCVVNITVQAPKPKKGKKPAPVKKSVTVQIS